MKYAKFVKELRKYGIVDKSWIQNNGHELPVKNHTVPVAIRELKPITRPCEFKCSEQVANQVVEYRRLGHKQRIWIRKCQNCGLYEHPVTGEMVDHRLINKYFPPRNPQEDK